MVWGALDLDVEERRESGMGRGRLGQGDGMGGSARIIDWERWADGGGNGGGGEVATVLVCGEVERDSECLDVEAWRVCFDARGASRDGEGLRG